MAETKIEYCIELRREIGREWEKINFCDDLGRAKFLLEEERGYRKQLNKTGYWHYKCRLTKTTITTEVVDE